MSTPLNLAVDIIRVVSRSTAGLDIASLADEISRRHPGSGYSSEAIAATLADEGRAAGRPLRDARLQH